MPKNIILLSDGTGNSASKLFKTNVWRLYQALDVAEPGAAKPGEMPKSAAGERAQPMQVAYYDDGVGTAAFTPLAILGGAFGWGLKRNVLDLYTFLCRHYEEGDSIYCFGFSRGAFTIRVLTGLVANQGLVSNLKEGKLRRLAADAFRAYRENRYPGSFLTKIFRGLRAGLLWVWYKITRRTKYNPKLNRLAPKIKFLGLWDTVAAYGLPVDELTHAWNYVFPLSFPDRNLSDRIERACHALALDDERLSFHPELWNENEEDYRRKRAQLQGAEAKPARHIQERLTQIWFAGMHTNVGGGYPDDGMAHVSLDWIMTEAEASELRFKQEDRERLKAAADINGKMYDSRGGVGGAYRYLPRKLKGLPQTLNALTHDDVENEDDRVMIDLPKIHESVFKRIKNRTEGYAPIGLPDEYVVFKSNGGIISLSDPEAEALGFVEHPTQAENRYKRQEGAWNLVWWKRVFYSISVVVFALLALFPFYDKPTHGWEEPLSLLSRGIGLLSTFLPDFLGGWIKAYQRHPGVFGILALLFLLLLSIGSKLRLRIFDRMRVLWNPTGKWPAAAEPVADLPKGALFNWRTSSLYQGLAKFFKERALPLLAGVTVVVILAAAAARGVYRVADSFGCFCPPTTNYSSVFRNSDPCWASGLRVEEGKRYRITISANANEPWKDGTIEPKNIGGFGTELMTSAMYLGLPFRRQFRAPWFKPIARIGRKGGDEYPLDGMIENDTKLTVEIKARRSGDLFLYLNDAVSLFPWTRFYDNNRGSAEVNVTCLDCNGSPTQ